MKLFIDSANLDHIREIHAWGVLAGVTTNPSLIAKEGGNFIQTVHEICEMVQGPVSAEVIAQDTAGMVREGKLLARIHKHVVVKVPLTAAGLGATRALTDAGIKTNVTLCFQASQALLAARAGATYISPFVGRVDDVASDGMALIEEIVAIYGQAPDITTQVLAASIRHPLHVNQSARAGADVATIPYDVFKKLVKHPLTDSGNERFLLDWATVPDRDIESQVLTWLARNG
jgi:transaldolase